MNSLLRQSVDLPYPLEAIHESRSTPSIALLTAGIDKPYVLGLSTALTRNGIVIDVIGGDDLAVPQLISESSIRFLNLRGNQTPDAPLPAKALRIWKYYLRLVGYIATSKVKLLHVLWNNKFEYFDRTLLLLYYRMTGKKIVFTAHNVNAGERDQSNSWLNKITLRIQYALVDHIFVHTSRGRGQLEKDFGVAGTKITVIPFGVNNTLPRADLSSEKARDQLNIASGSRVLLFFGQIAPYKGLTFLIRALQRLIASDQSYRLIIAGKPKWSGRYWKEVEDLISEERLQPYIIERIEHISDGEVETFFKAADVLILPYTDIFQSGVLSLGYDFGLPVVATDVGSLREEIEEGRTGFVCKPQDAEDLARTIGRYFESELYHRRDEARDEIRAYANDKYSWQRVAELTTNVYTRLMANG